jgi:hypothetical protein
MSVLTQTWQAALQNANNATVAKNVGGIDTFATAAARIPPSDFVSPLDLSLHDKAAHAFKRAPIDVLPPKQPASNHSMPRAATRFEDALSALSETVTTAKAPAGKTTKTMMQLDNKPVSAEVSIPSRNGKPRTGAQSSHSGLMRPTRLPPPLPPQQHITELPLTRRGVLSASNDAKTVAADTRTLSSLPAIRRPDVLFNGRVVPRPSTMVSFVSGPTSGANARAGAADAVTITQTDDAHVVSFPKEPRQIFVALSKNVIVRYIVAGIITWLIIFLAILAARPSFIMMTTFQDADTEGRPRIVPKPSAAKAAIIALFIVLLAVAAIVAIVAIVQRKKTQNSLHSA